MIIEDGIMWSLSSLKLNQKNIFIIENNYILAFILFWQNIDRLKFVWLEKKCIRKYININNKKKIYLESFQILNQIAKQFLKKIRDASK